MRARVGIVAGLTLVAWSATSVTASAAPKGMPIDVDCGDQSFQAVVNGGGNSPAFVVGGGLFIPTSFEDFSGTVLDEEGSIVDEYTFTDEFTEVKGNSAKKKDTVDCTFSFMDDSDPNLPEGYTFVGSGGVTGYFVH